MVFDSGFTLLGGGVNQIRSEQVVYDDGREKLKPKRKQGVQGGVMPFVGSLRGNAPQ